MLVSAFDGDSGAVSLDLLTGEDLDVLRQANGLGSKSAPNQSAVVLARTKRYLILTYQGEFDKVHYPMALTYCDQEDVSELKRTIVRLRDEMDTIRKSQVDSKSLREVEVLVMSYKSEKDKLGRELAESHGVISQLQSEISSLQNENHLLQTKIQVLESHALRPSLPKGAIRPASNGAPLRSRASSLASSPANSLRSSPLRDRNAVSRGSSPKGPSPYRQPMARRPPVSPRRPMGQAVSPIRQKRDVSPKRSLTGTLRPTVITNSVGSIDGLPGPPVALSEVDARLQALQNFLRHQKATAARG